MQPAERIFLETSEAPERLTVRIPYAVHEKALLARS